MQATKEDTVSVSAPGGFSLAGIPASFLGWLFVAGMACFLLYQVTSAYDKKLDVLIDIGRDQVKLLERLTTKP